MVQIHDCECVLPNVSIIIIEWAIVIMGLIQQPILMFRNFNFIFYV